MATSLKQSATESLINQSVFGSPSKSIDPRKEIPHLAITDAKRLIKQKYERVGNVVGKAASDVQGIDNTSAYFQNFANGCIVATTLQANHVFEIHGAIYAKWNEMGRAAYGLPLTDEMTTPDGAGRYNHFTGGRSIYWHPATGAHAVYGDIRTLWSENGWETSALGYPVSDELAAGDDTGRISNFQHGAIYWSPLTGAYILPEFHTWSDTIVTGGLTALGGNYELTFYRNGNFIFKGHLHNSGSDNYDTQLAVAILDTLGTAYTFEHKGHTSGTWSTGSRDDDWVNSGYNENIAKHWGQMQFAAYSRVFNYDSEIASAVQDAVADALAKLVQAGIQAGVNAVITLIAA